MKTHNLAFIDTETTGLNPDYHEVIEFACVIARQTPREGQGPKIEIIEEFELKIKPEHLERAEEQALRVNGYNEADWLFAIEPKKAFEFIAKKVEGCNMVSHNITFDHAFVTKSFERYGIENTLCELIKVENAKAHTALADTHALVEVYKKMMRA